MDKLAYNRVLEAEQLATSQFEKINDVALFNQEKVLSAFQTLNISTRHFNPSFGYGYDDIGRDTLAKLFATVFRAEDAIVSPLITSGTHALTIALFGILRPKDKLLAISGKPYDTLDDVISSENKGSLKDFLIEYDQIDLINDDFNYCAISDYLTVKKPKMIHIQRSRGYAWRNAISLENITKVIELSKRLSPDTIIMVDNCYGEFVDTKEPIECGADLIVGSLIKNPGGGIALTGGYIVGSSRAIEQVSYRFTSPSIGKEVGSYAMSYLPFYQGFFLAPSVVANALKGNILAGYVFKKLGYEVSPDISENPKDIIRSIKFNTEEELILFCQAIQYASPIDSFATPFPWDMPGYNHQVIMAAGAFVQGSSIELSADSPIKAPYIAYLQGGLTYEHIKIAIAFALEKLNLV